MMSNPAATYYNPDSDEQKNSITGLTVINCWMCVSHCGIHFYAYLILMVCMSCINHMRGFVKEYTHVTG